MRPVVLCCVLVGYIDCLFFVFFSKNFRSYLYQLSALVMENNLVRNVCWILM